MAVTCTVRDIAEWVQGEVVGDPEYVIRAAKPLSDAPGAEDITVVIEGKLLAQFHASSAGAAIVDRSVAANGKTVVRVADPLLAFVRVVQRLHVKPVAAFAGTHPTALIHSTAQIGPDARIGPHVTVGEGTVIGARCRLAAGAFVGNHCCIGDDLALGPNVVIYDGCILGNRVFVLANSVIGADGFGYRTIAGRHEKVPQVGIVEIADDVEIGACTTIDRATFGATRIGAGTKIDNLVQIAHNCQIGRNNLIAAQVGIAGSAITGDYVAMGGQSGIVDHCSVGDRTQLGAKTGVTKDFGPDLKLLGMPAFLATERLRMLSSLVRLPAYRKKLREIQKHLGLADS